MMQRPLITPEERAAYGDEALSVMGRKAQEVFQPVVQDMQRQNQQLRSELQRVKANDVYSTLDQFLPEWRSVNQNQDWKDWLSEPDIYNGVSRQQLLNQAFASGDAGRVLAFFRGFQAENTQQPTARAPRMSPDNAQPFITNADIDRFYADIRKGLYAGREQEKAARESQIHRAIVEGKLRRVP
jgi:hypothetical protein